MSWLQVLTKLPFALILLMPYMFTTIDGVILSSSDELRELEHDIGDSASLSCTARLQEGNALTMSVKGSIGMILMARPLDQLYQIVMAAGYGDKFSFVSSDISSSQPLYRNVTIFLTINEVQASDAGLYQCEATNRSKVFYDLRVMGPPTDVKVIAKPEQGVEVVRLTTFDKNEYPGSHSVWLVSYKLDMIENFDLTADVTSDPPANVTWRRNSTWIGQRKLITITRIEDDLNGSKMISTASNAYGDYSISLIFEAQYAPRSPIVNNAEVYPEEGKPLSIVCQFDASPPATVFYAKEDAITNQWQRLNATDNGKDKALYIHDVELDKDIGTYKCVGENVLGVETGLITVYGKPKDVSLELVNVYGNSVDVRFKAFSAIPVIFELHLRYTDKDGVQVTSNTNLDRRADQTAPNIRLLHSVSLPKPDTEYTLSTTAKNRHGSADSKSESEIVFTSASEDVLRPATSKIVAVTAATTTTDPNSAANVQIFSVLLWCAVGNLVL